MSFMDPNIEAAGQGERAPRQRRLIRAQLFEQDNAPRDIVIRNVSRTGIGAACQDGPPASGAAVTLFLPGCAPISGTVRWVTGNAFGVALDGVLDLEAMAGAVQRKVAPAEPYRGWQVEDAYKVTAAQPVDKSRFRRV